MLHVVGAFTFTVLIGTPIAFALIFSGLAYLLATGAYPSTLSSYLFSTLNSSALLSIPFFILSAEILNHSGATKRLVTMVDAWVGHNRGGLPVVAVITVAFFSAICGSSAATAAAIGSVMIPEMVDRGYDRRFTVGLIATAGGLGILIPPSIPLIIYGMITEISIDRLFKAAMLPGICLATILGVVAYFMGRRSGVAPSPRRSWAYRVSETRQAGGVLLMPVIILGGINTGLFTATESAAIACVYALGLAVVAFKMPFEEIPRMLTGSASTAAMILLILAAANLFSYALTSERVPHAIFEFLTRMQMDRWQLLMMLMLFFIVAGMFLEVISIILITMPILLPVLTAAEINPVHFAILLVVNMELAVITPPIGLNLFVISAISKVPVLDVFRGTLPFALVLVLFLLGLMYMPGAGWLMGG